MLLFAKVEIFKEGEKEQPRPYVSGCYFLGTTGRVILSLSDINMKGSENWNQQASLNYLLTCVIPQR